MVTMDHCRIAFPRDADVDAVLECPYDRTLSEQGAVEAIQATILAAAGKGWIAIESAKVETGYEFGPESVEELRRFGAEHGIRLELASADVGRSSEAEESVIELHLGSTVVYVERGSSRVPRDGHFYVFFNGQRSERRFRSSERATAFARRGAKLINTRSPS